MRESPANERLLQCHRFTARLAIISDELTLQARPPADGSANGAAAPVSPHTCHGRAASILARLLAVCVPRNGHPGGADRVVSPL